MDKVSVDVVIPCYNEEETLPALFYKLEKVEDIIDQDGKYKINFIFVNDGSTDKTLEILKQEFNKRGNVNILALEKNSGFGAALRTGLKAAVSDFVVTIDADTNYDQLEIPKILDYLTDEFDLVTASPFHPDGQWNFPMHRFITSRTVARLYKIALRRRYGSDLSTFTSGFRVYRGKILESIMPTASDFLATAQLLLNAVLKEYRVCEYPTVVYERKFGKSKLKTFQTIISHLKFIFKVFRTR